MRKDILVYLSGPISPLPDYSVEINVAVALDSFLKLTQMGIPSFCPHLTAIFPSAHNIPYEMWMEYDYAVINRCSHMLLLPRWESSRGAIMEKQYADSLGMPVVYKISELVDVLHYKDSNAL